MDELKPCPFCDGEAISGCAFGMTRMHYYASCANCGAQGPSFAEDEGGEAKADAAWNHRNAGVAVVPAPQTEPEPRLVGYEECRCILTQYCDGTCQPVFALPAVLDRAKTLYANSPGAYRGTTPLPWDRAPMPTRLEFIGKAKVEVGLAALRTDGVPAVAPLAQQLTTAVDAIDAGHDPLCMAVVRGKECTCGVQATLPAESYDAIWNALQRIDTVAAFLPTYEVKHEGGIEAFTQNIVEAILAAREKLERNAGVKGLGDAQQ